jgi:FkbM family methyltransferase
MSRPAPFPFQRLRDLMGPFERLKYLLWRSGGLGRGELTTRLASGDRLVLRPPPTNDLDNAMEIYVFRVYEPLPELANQQIDRIVDLGANIGLSVLYFAGRFPQAQIEAYEPHPVHLAQIRRQIEANGIASRVELFAAAAGTREGEVFLTDAQMQSAITDESRPGNLRVPMVDWVARERGKRIDLLKIDIEGSEYDLLLDHRFAEVRPTHIVFEWHARPSRPQGHEELVEHLKSLEYEVRDVSEGQLGDLRLGMSWASRRID